MTSFLFRIIIVFVFVLDGVSVVMSRRVSWNRRYQL
jgi:hypothetical protein